MLGVKSRVAQAHEVSQGVRNIVARQVSHCVHEVINLSSVKRWSKRYDGTWQSLAEQSHRPKSHPNQHTEAEETAILSAFKAKFFRYGWDEHTS
ncbi:hypothetical protein FACS18949_14890 [Clostridia bacterium]|nr:hypothetical protein FACS189425_05050 [Clostridia bacterium]GHV35983.1 hypothetical protein FACS18949_14890 [Clostridia bacterium]